MDSLVLAVCILVGIGLFKLIAKKHSENNGVRLLLIFLGITLGALPLILLKESLIPNGVLNIVISAISAVYFAILISRIGKNSEPSKLN